MPLKSCKSIAFALHVDVAMVESVVNDFDLFTNDGEKFWSKSVITRLGKRADIAEKRKAAAIKRWQSSKDKQEQCKADASALQNDTKERKEKERKEDNKENIKEKSGHRFSPPTIEEIRAYILEKGYSFDAERFFDFYESKGWFVGKNKMKDWKAAIRNWAKGEKERRSAYSGNKTTTKVNDEWK